MGVNPRTGERIQIAASRVPRFTRGQRAEERGEGPLTPARPFGDTLAARVAERESQIVLGLDPDPGALWPGRASRRRRTSVGRAPLRSAPRARCSATAAR